MDLGDVVLVCRDCARGWLAGRCGCFDVAVSGLAIPYNQLVSVVIPVNEGLKGSLDHNTNSVLDLGNVGNVLRSRANGDLVVGEAFLSFIFAGGSETF